MSLKRELPGTSRLNGPNLAGAEAAEAQLVLRTVFIPSKHDQELRDVAGRLHVSKSEVIRRAIESYLSHPELDRDRSPATA